MSLPCGDMGAEKGDPINLFRPRIISSWAWSYFTVEKRKKTSISKFNSGVARFFLGVKRCQTKIPNKHSLSLKRRLSPIAENSPLLPSRRSLGRCLSPSVADHPLGPATDHRLGKLLPHQLANQTRAPPRADSSFCSSAYGVLAAVSSCCSPPKGRSSKGSRRPTKARKPGSFRKWIPIRRVHNRMDKLTLTRQFGIQFGIFLGRYREGIGM
ncbi:30S ribosomal protein S12-B, chloroplastic [Melia azedarach]|nr:30S ribosomal protein S12-B, chloroplastic [Melia azedarach]